VEKQKQGITAEKKGKRPGVGLEIKDSRPKKESEGSEYPGKGEKGGEGN